MAKIIMAIGIFMVVWGIGYFFYGIYHIWNMGKFKPPLNPELKKYFRDIEL